MKLTINVRDIGKLNRREVHYSITGSMTWTAIGLRGPKIQKGAKDWARYITLTNETTKETYGWTNVPDVGVRLVDNDTQPSTDWYILPNGARAEISIISPSPHWVNKLFKKENYRDYPVYRGFNKNEYGRAIHPKWGRGIFFKNDEQVAKWQANGHVSYPHSYDITYAKGFEEEIHILILKLLASNFWRYGRASTPIVSSKSVRAFEETYREHLAWEPME